MFSNVQTKSPQKTQHAHDKARQEQDQNQKIHLSDSVKSIMQIPAAALSSSSTGEVYHTDTEENTSRTQKIRLEGSVLSIMQSRATSSRKNTERRVDAPQCAEQSKEQTQKTPRAIGEDTYAMMPKRAVSSPPNTAVTSDQTKRALHFDRLEFRSGQMSDQATKLKRLSVVSPIPLRGVSSIQTIESPRRLSTRAPIIPSASSAFSRIGGKAPCSSQATPELNHTLASDRLLETNPQETHRTVRESPTEIEPSYTGASVSQRVHMFEKTPVDSSHSAVDDQPLDLSVKKTTVHPQASDETPEESLTFQPVQNSPITSEVQMAIAALRTKQGHSVKMLCEKFPQVNSYNMEKFIRENKLLAKGYRQPKPDEMGFSVIEIGVGSGIPVHLQKKIFTLAKSCMSPENIQKELQSSNDFKMEVSSIKYFLTTQQKLKQAYEMKQANDA